MTWLMNLIEFNNFILKKFYLTIWFKKSAIGKLSNDFKKIVKK
jgi:hypothetical protein